jgi:hypothetical protein
LVSAIGITITLHYCGGDLASLGFFNKTSCCCDDEKVIKKKDDCCKNEYKSFKIKDEQIKAELNEKKFQQVDFSLNKKSTLIFFKKNIEYPTSITLTQLPRPPDKENLIPAYKRNHSFLFYS